MATLERTRKLIDAGYHVIEKWECDDIKTKEKQKQKSRQKRTQVLFSMILSCFMTAQRQKKRPII